MLNDEEEKNRKTKRSLRHKAAADKPLKRDGYPDVRHLVWSHASTLWLAIQEVTKTPLVLRPRVVLHRWDAGFPAQSRGTNSTS